MIDVGPGVVGIMPGDRVAYACPPVGAYAQVRTMKADQLVVLPAEIDDQTAAAAMLKGMTAEYLLRRTHRVQARRHGAGPRGGRRRRHAALPVGAPYRRAR